MNEQPKQSHCLKPSGSTGPAKKEKAQATVVTGLYPRCGCTLDPDNGERIYICPKHAKQPTVADHYGHGWVAGKQAGSTGPAEAPEEETHMSHGSTVQGDAGSLSPIAPWQPIATAPKTTTHVLVYTQGNRCTNLVTWHESTGWTHAFSDWRPLHEEPTHWMPLPARPPGEATNAGVTHD